MTKDLSVFQDSMERWLTTGVFYELAQGARKAYATYHLAEAKKLYMDTNDITGYRFAVDHLGGWDQLQAMWRSPTLKPILQSWEEDLEMKIRSDAIRNIIEASTKEKGFSASRFLADRGWKDKKVGRRSMEEIERNAKADKKMYAEFDNVVDFKG